MRLFFAFFLAVLLSAGAAFSVRAQSVAVGGAHACALAQDGRVACWGENTDGQVGNGTLDLAWTTPQATLPAGSASALRAGETHTCAARPNGTVACWGSNAFGKLGFGYGVAGREVVTTPTAVPGLSGVAGVALGLTHTCALRTNGTVACWGDNVYGQLGDGSTTLRPVPTDVPGLAGATALAVGDYHTCALVAGGAVTCWGLNDNGQLGDGSGAAQSSPVAVTGLTGAVALDAGAASTCAMLSGGR